MINPNKIIIIKITSILLIVLLVISLKLYLKLSEIVKNALVIIYDPSNSYLCISTLFVKLFIYYYVII